MATTLSSDLFTPEVWADLAFEQFTGKAVVAQYALQDDSLAGQPGETVNFPKWMTLSEMDDVAETDVLVPEKLGQSNSQATIKEAAKAVEISDKAKLVGVGNAQDEAIRQFGVLAARKVDADLIAAAQASIAGGVTYADGTAATASAPLGYTTTAGSGVDALPYAQIVAGVGQFGDEFEPEDFAGLFVNAATWGKLMVDEQFISANQLATGNQVVTRGQVGSILGVPVIVSNRIASGKSLLVKRNALGVMWKRRPLVEQDRDILARTTVVATNMHYAVKRLNDDGVLVYTHTA